MFSFKAYFWNNEVYINGQYKYAANEILTAYLNTDLCKLIKKKDVIYKLKRLKRSIYIKTVHLFLTVRSQKSLISFAKQMQALRQFLFNKRR